MRSCFPRILIDLGTLVVIVTVQPIQLIEVHVQRYDGTQRLKLLARILLLSACQRVEREFASALQWHEPMNDRRAYETVPCPGNYPL